MPETSVKVSNLQHSQEHVFHLNSDKYTRTKTIFILAFSKRAKENSIDSCEEFRPISFQKAGENCFDKLERKWILHNFRGLIYCNFIFGFLLPSLRLVRKEKLFIFPSDLGASTLFHAPFYFISFFLQLFFSFFRLCRLVVHPSNSPQFFLSRAKLPFCPPPSSQGKMIEKYEKFYGKISVDSGIFLSSQLFFCAACVSKNLLNFLFNIFKSSSEIIVSLLFFVLFFGESMKFSINP